MSSEINLFEIRLGHGDGGGRIDGEADLFAEGFDLPEQRSDGFAQLDVDVDLIRAGLGERLQEDLRLGAHQVRVEEQLRQRTERPHHRRAEGEIGHEMAVHDVQVQPVGARRRSTRSASLASRPKLAASNEGATIMRKG